MNGVLDLRDGPMVMEMPSGLLGTLNNIWQQPLCDLGGPFSPDQNLGGRFLILLPGYDGPPPEVHHDVVESDSNIVVFYFRGIWRATTRPRHLGDRTCSTVCARRGRRGHQ